MSETTSDIKRRLRRSKDSERRLGKWQLTHDGPDPRFRPGGGLVTTTGRVGHVTGLQFDTLSRTYAGENKQQKVWAGLWGFWLKIVAKAKEQGKEPLLSIEPTNDDATAPIMHIITREHHAELLAAYHAQQDQIAEQRAYAPSTVRPYTKEQQTGRHRSKRR